MVHIELPSPYFSVGRVPLNVNKHVPLNNMVKVVQGEVSKRPVNVFSS